MPLIMANVSPGEVFIGEEALDVGVNEALGPAGGEKCGYGDETERGLRGALALEGERVFETPVCIGEFGVDQ